MMSLPSSVLITPYPKYALSKPKDLPFTHDTKLVPAIFEIAVVYLAAIYVDTVYHDLDKNHLRFYALNILFKILNFFTY